MTEKPAVFHVEHNQEALSACPICGSSKQKTQITIKDHSHTNETFNIVSCGECGFLYTNPRPSPEAVSRYYEFEDYISHSNTNKGFLSKLYQSARSYALLKKLQLVLRVSKKKGPVLDYGCGTGEFLNVCKRAGWEVMGVEPSENARNQAIINYNLSVIAPDGDLPENYFKVVSLWHVLEHLPDLNQSFSLFNKLLLNDGTLIIAVPNPTSFEAKKYKEYWAAYDVPRHFYHFRPQDIEALAEKHNFKVVETLPMLMDAFYISLLSEKYKTGKQNYIKAFITGLRSNLHGLKYKNRYSSQIYVLKKRNKAI